MNPFRSLYILAVFAAVAGTMSAQQNTPVAYSALNAASYENGTLSPGSLFTVFGSSLGPATLAQAGSLPLPTVLAGTIVTVTAGGKVLNCPLLYTSAGQLAAALPSSTPLGSASLSVTYSNVKGPSLAITVVASAVGLFALNGSGSGGGIFTELDGTVVRFTPAAKPGDILTLWATGIGAGSEPDGGIPSTFPGFSGVEIFVGSQAATVIYAGRSGCCAAVDQISFKMPQVAPGCYTPVTVRSGGHVSNFVSLPVGGGAASATSCSDATPALSPTNVNLSANGKPVKMGVLGVGPIGVLAGLGFDSRTVVARSLTAALRVRITPEEAGLAMHAAQTGNTKGLAHLMPRYAAAWKKLDAKTKKHIQGLLSFNQTGAYGAFTRYDSATVLGPFVGTLFTPAGSCSVWPPSGPPLTSSGTPLDAGSSLTMVGPRGGAILKPTRVGQYQALIGTEVVAGNIDTGTYTIAGGSKDVGAFSLSLATTPPPVISNKASIANADPAQPLTVRWTNGPAAGYVLIGGYSAGLSEAFACTEDSSKGTFTIPTQVIGALRRKGEKQATIFIGAHPLSHPISIPGLDAAYFMDGSFDSTAVAFQVAGPPVLTITKSHTGVFKQGQLGASYNITVNNAVSAGPTNGTVTVTEQPPPDFLLSAMTGSGWICSAVTCLRTDSLAPGATYPAITVTGNVSLSAATKFTNQVSVSGGGATTATANDETIVSLTTGTTTALADRIAFIAQTASNSIAGFEDVPANAFAPFVTNGVSFTGTQPQVLNSLVGLGTSYWFAGLSSGSQFLITNLSLSATFPSDVKAMGFDYHCFACATTATGNTFAWTMLSSTGAVVATGSSAIDFRDGVRFFGLISNASFRSITISGTSGNWVADNVRFAP